MKQKAECPICGNLVETFNEEDCTCPSCGSTIHWQGSSAWIQCEPQRPTWDEYFINIAQHIAERATCTRAVVGAVIVKDNHILSTGYNGAPSGEPHCLEAGCLMENGHCVRTIHAETNAVVQAARFGVSVDGATLYFWDSMDREADSCTKCFQVMKAAGIKRIVNKYGREILL